MKPKRIAKKLIPQKTFRLIEPAGHKTEAVLLNAQKGFPLRGLKVIGVTGTNGKTTTSFMIHRMLTEAGIRAGLMTTVAYGVGEDIHPQIEHMTSVSVPTLLRRVVDMKAQGIEWLVLETTSHALAQYRVWGVPYSIAVMTNVTHEHLDYHGTFENYRDAKRRLFKMCNRNSRGLRLGVINAEDPSASLFSRDIAHRVTYGIEKGDIQAVNLDLTPAGSHYLARIGEETYDITCHLPGRFNVSNSLAAVSVGRALGLSRPQIEAGIAALRGVEGRMTRIDEGQDFEVIIDYAHTPDSFEKLFKDLRPMVKGKLIVMFGSAGRRDEAKRAVQGNIAGQYADEIILTEEDDRDLDGLAILDDIARGAETAGKIRNNNLFLVHDRSKAIEFSMGRAAPGDVVLLLGKGHEKDILRNGPRAAELRHLPQDDHDPERVIEQPWDESGVARQVAKKLSRKH